MKRKETMMSLQFPQRAGRTVAILVVLLLALFFSQIGTQAQNEQVRREQACFNLVQGKVAYDKAGNKNWSENNIRNLCQSTTDPSKTIACFQAEIQSHGDWKRGIEACKYKPQPAAPSAERKFPETSRPPPTNFNPDPKAAYIIIEGTKGERLAAGSDDRVLRWGMTGGNEQRWQFVPSENYPGRYNLKSLKFDNWNTNKVLDIQWVTGSASIYPANKKAEQTFTVTKLTNEEAARLAPNLYKDYKDLGVDFVQIREWSRDGKELLTVSSNGAVNRWTPLNDNSQVFILRKEVAGADAVRLSYDDPLPYVEVGPRSWKWNQGVPYTRTIYNPLDGGVLLRYEMTEPPRNSDGCSGGAYEYLIKFRYACFGHDTNGDAPFDKAGFPTGADGISTGKDLADYLFLKDMLAEAKKEAPARINIVATAAYFSYRVVQDRNDYRGASKGMKVIDKETGGVIAIKNNGWFTIGIRVKWIAPQGSERVEEVYNGGGRPAVIPLSNGAKNIEVVCWAVGGKEIFKKTFPTKGMYTFTVRGKLPNESYVEGLKAD
jgi:hypothetical protein